MRVIRPGLSEWVYLFCNAFGFLTDRLYPVEECLFRNLFSVLPDGHRDLFRKQLASLKIFQRWYGWRTLAMFPMRHFWQRRGTDRFPEELRVPTDKDDVRLASFKFRVPGEQNENNAVFHLFRGRLITVEFGSYYRLIRFADEVEIIKYKVDHNFREQ